MNAKTLCSFIILAFSFTLVYGQKVTSFTEKKDYKIEEKITVEFEVKAEVDSNTNLICDGFTIVKGPSKSTSYSITNGKIENSYRLTYVLKANRVGEIWVPSPYFYIMGKPEMGPIIVLKISGENLSEEELKKLQIDSF
ncbi:MAG TPA: BatD family protein, partial [Bacteroidia bacterium]|nr:BatD family protein [Bacteroidia bacterium]